MYRSAKVAASSLDAIAAQGVAGLRVLDPAHASLRLIACFGGARVRTILVLLLATVALAACSASTGTPAARTPNVGSVSPPQSTASGGTNGARFPAGVSADGRYFIDQVGDPWFGLGDSPWSIIVQLAPADVDLYLDDRMARGFNLIMANLLEHHYSENAPNNYRDDPPFTGDPFRSAPNEAYWQQVDYVIEAARVRGITVLLCPAYLGRATSEGWSSEVAEATNEEMAEFGRFLRDRYEDFPNIMWLVGHDRVPNDTDRARMEALASELPPGDLVGLGGVPADEESTGTGTWAWSPTTISPDFETVYSYRDTPVSDTANAWAMQPTRPLMFLEGRYEQEREGGLGDPVVRRQEYGSFVGGAAAVMFGNNPIWHFNSVSLYEYEGTWQANLGSPGAGDAQRFGELALSLPWWEMQPDLGSDLLIDGELESNLAARSSDSHAVVYVPTSRTVVVDIARLSAVEQVELRRFDPRSGESEFVDSYPTDRLVAIDSPGPNAAGEEDWVYVFLPTG